MALLSCPSSPFWRAALWFLPLCFLCLFSRRVPALSFSLSLFWLSLCRSPDSAAFSPLPCCLSFSWPVSFGSFFSVLSPLLPLAVRCHRGRPAAFSALELSARKGALRCPCIVVLHTFRIPGTVRPSPLPSPTDCRTIALLRSPRPPPGPPRQGGTPAAAGGVAALSDFDTTCHCKTSGASWDLPSF